MWWTGHPSWAVHGLNLRDRLILDLQMKSNRYMARGQARRCRRSEDVVNVAVPRLDVVGFGIQVVPRVWRR
jgi:hypothetical protein